MRRNIWRLWQDGSQQQEQPEHREKVEVSPPKEQVGILLSVLSTMPLHPEFGEANGPYDALASTQVADNVVRFEFAGSALAVGNPWEIVTAPACLDFHGKTFEVPQGGEVG
jgi:hypothetical protein